jgi:hypothetical protein
VVDFWCGLVTLGAESIERWWGKTGELAVFTALVRISHQTSNLDK